MTRTISILVACAMDRAIGKDNQLLWSLPEDLKLFKSNTLGKTVVMGRKTAESIGRALPGRLNIVLSRTQRQPPYPGQLLAGSLHEALALAPADTEVCVIGGESVYREAQPMINKLYLTLVHDTFPDADAHYPCDDLQGINLRHSPPLGWRRIDYRTYPEQGDQPAFTYGEYLHGA